VAAFGIKKRKKKINKKIKVANIKKIKNKTKKEYLIDIGKVKGIYCEMVFYKEVKSNFGP